MDQREGRADTQRVEDAYRARIRLASKVVVFGLAIILALSAMLPTTPPGDRDGLLVSAALVLAAGIGWFALVPHGWFGEARVSVAAAIAELVLGVTLRGTGGVGSRYFAYFLLPVLVTILPGHLPHTVAVGGIGGILLVLLALLQPGGATDAIRDTTVTRLLELGAITVFAAIAARATGQTRRALEARTAELTSERQEAFRMAITDELTGLYNRHFLREQLPRLVAQATRHARPFAVISFDVDGLKRVNDSQGHQAGDDLLRRTGEALRTSLRAEDIAVRVGGDEFVALLPEADRGDAVQAAYRIRQRIATQPGDGSVSAGIGVWRRGMEPEEVLGQADRELYRSKTGRGSGGAR